MENMETCKQLMKENETLKRSLALSLDSSLVKRLKEALDRVNSGNYVSEKEFFSH
jgi:hypothetical protein